MRLSYCLCVTSEVTRQRLRKHVPATVNTHVIELFDALFSMLAVSYQILNV
jgi:hypothetical protein